MSRFNEHGLTPQQEAFAVAVAAGSNLSDAYRGAYKAGRMTAKQINEEACKLADNPKVTRFLPARRRQRRSKSRPRRKERLPHRAASWPCCRSRTCALPLRKC